MSEARKPGQDGIEPRRRFFRRTAIGAVIGTMAAGFGWRAFAAGGEHGGWHRSGAAFDPAKLEQRLERMLKHLYAEIDATPEQQARLAPIVKDAARDLFPLRGKMRAARKQAIELLTQDSIDRVAIEALRAEQLQLAEQASKRLTQAVGDAAEVLSPAQRKQLAERLAHRRRRWMHG